MRRALSSLLLSRVNGSSTPWSIGNSISKVSHSGVLGHMIRNPDYVFSLEERSEQGFYSFKSSISFSILMYGRASYVASLQSCTIRGYATMRGSSNQVSAHGVQESQKKSQATLMYLVALVIAMVGCSYAAVPLYRKFCQATGYGGTVRRRETVEEKIARHAHDGASATRPLVVQFNADIADGLPWKFTPTQREVRVKPGQSTLAFFTAENLSSKAITGVSTYNVTPMKAKQHLLKQDPLPMDFGIEDDLDKIDDEMTVVIFNEILLLESTLLHQHLPPLSQVVKDYALFVMVITGDAEPPISPSNASSAAAAAAARAPPDCDDAVDPGGKCFKIKASLNAGRIASQPPQCPVVPIPMRCFKTLAAPYFNKIQCFCFEEQRLRPGEKIDMPVFFYIDPEFATDPKMGNINNLILSYTFFKVEDEDSSSKD
ncbi:hypothetical protein L7F22_007998 [Adiantum nelumboides]|nr:hypothetical protein [Adiantum nelumboides]